VQPQKDSSKESIMNKSLRSAAVVAAAVWALAGPWRQAQAAAPFALVSTAEAQQAARAEAEAPAEIRPRSVPGPRGLVPSIRVISPAVGSRPGTAVPAPLRIELAFQPAAGTHIVPSSFRVLYGLLKIDLTERLRKHATVTEAGVLVEGAQMPDGQHRLLLQVADDQGNTAERELLFRVGGAL
jgi:hypothetical protein